MALTKVPNELLVTPGGSSTNGGADIRTLTAPLNLTVADGRFQKLYSDAGVGDLNVFLPDATTLTEGGPAFIIKNDGFNNFMIRDFNGNLLAIIGTKQLGTFMLADNTTSAGTWTAGNQSYNSTAFIDFLFSGYTTILGTASTLSGPSLIQLDTNSFLAAYPDSSQNLNLLAFSVNGNVITLGTPTSGASFLMRQPRLTKLTSTTAFLYYVNQSTEQTYGRVVTVSGLTVTPDTETALGFQSPGTSDPSIATLSPTSVILLTGRQSASFMDVRAVSISGTTISAVGTLAATETASNAHGEIIAIDSSRALIIYNQFSGSSRCAVVSVSGLTCTINTPSSIGTTMNRYDLTQLTPTRFVGTGTSGSDSYLFLITLVSPTDAAATSPVSITGLVGFQTILTSVTALRSDKLLMVVKNDTTGNTQLIIVNITGTTFSYSGTTSILINAAFASYPRLLMISSSKAINLNSMGVSGLRISVIEPVDI